MSFPSVRRYLFLRLDVQAQAQHILCLSRAVIKKDVEFLKDCVGPEVEKKVNAASDTQV